MSEQQIASGDGYVEFTVDQAGTTKILGLSNGDSGTSANEIDYAIVLWNSSGTEIYENGAWKCNSTSYAVGDVFRIEISADSVTYRHNGGEICTHSATPTYPLLVDTSLWSSGARIADVMITAPAPSGASDVEWSAIVNATANGSSLFKSGGCAGCADAGAVSTQEIASGNGYVEFTIDQTGASRTIGLSNGNDDLSSTDIDYGIHFWINPPTNCDVYESGVWKSSCVGGYAVGDVFRIEIRDGNVEYSKNGAAPFYSHAVTPTYPLLVDTSLWTLGAGVANAKISSGEGSPDCNQDNEIHLPPDYSTLLPPAAGQSYTDATYCRSIKRITDSTGGSDAFEVVRYSTQNHFNADESKIAVEYSGAGAYVRIRDSSSGSVLYHLTNIGSSDEVMWDRSDPDVFYFQQGNEFLKGTLGAGGLVDQMPLRTFSEYTSISSLGEADLSPNGDHIGLVGEGSSGKEVFVYTISTDSKGPVLNIGSSWLDKLQITDTYVVLSFQDFAGQGQEVHVYDHSMQFQRKLVSANKHSDVGVDEQGNQVLYTLTATQPAGCENSIAKYRLDTGAVNCLVPGTPGFAWNLTGQVAAPEVSSQWVYFSLYPNCDPPSTCSWNVYTSEIIRVRNDGSGVIERLAHHHSRAAVVDSQHIYEASPRASVNRSGTKVLYNSNFGLQHKSATCGCSVADSYNDTYLLIP